MLVETLVMDKRESTSREQKPATGAAGSGRLHAVGAALAPGAPRRFAGDGASQGRGRTAAWGFNDNDKWGRTINTRNFRRYLSTHDAEKRENDNGNDSVRPVRFTRYSRDEIARNNILALCRGALEFHAGNRMHAIEPIVWRRPVPLPGLAVIVLDIGGQRLFVQLSRWPPTDAAARLPSLGRIAAMPRALRRIVAKAGFGDFLPVLEGVFEQPVEVIDLHDDMAAIDYEESMQFRLDRGSELALVSLFSSSQFIATLLEKLRRWRPAENGLTENLALPAFMEIGYSTVSRADLEALAVGDVVLLEPCDFLARRLIRARVMPNLEIYLKLEQGKAMIDDIKQDNSVETQQGEPVNIDELNVTLTFDVGVQQLPLHELKKIHKGYTFELTRPLGQLVTIRCNGQKIGMAELVEVEDRVGMRVVSVIGS